LPQYNVVHNGFIDSGVKLLDGGLPASGIADIDFDSGSRLGNKRVNRILSQSKEKAL
jgi:hypothetical protein